MERLQWRNCKQNLPRPTILKLATFSFPDDNKLRKLTIRAIKNLLKFLKCRYKLCIPINIEDGHVCYPEFSSFLVRFFDSCKKTYGFVDITWISYLNLIIKQPNCDTLKLIKYCIEKADFNFLEHFLYEALNQSGKYQNVIEAQFFSIRNLALKQGQGPWGVCQKTYPSIAVALETTGYEESIYHEFLHMLGVSEGYDELTKNTLKGCENCWMQWNATKGNSLCQRHVDELKQFIKKIQDKSDK